MNTFNSIKDIGDSQIHSMTQGLEFQKMPKMFDIFKSFINSDMSATLELTPKSFMNGNDVVFFLDNLQCLLNSPNNNAFLARISNENLQIRGKIQYLIENRLDFQPLYFIRNFIESM